MIKGYYTDTDGKYKKAELPPTDKSFSHQAKSLICKLDGKSSKHEATCIQGCGCLLVYGPGYYLAGNMPLLAMQLLGSREFKKHLRMFATIFNREAWTYIAASRP